MDREDAAFLEADAKPIKLPRAFDNLSEYWKPKTARALQQVRYSLCAAFYAHPHSRLNAYACDSW